MSKALGCTFTDKITGFRGVAVGRVEYLTGCNQVLLAPKSANGEHKDSVWFDEQRCAEDTTVDRIVLDNGTTPGFDKPAPIR